MPTRTGAGKSSAGPPSSRPLRWAGSAGCSSPGYRQLTIAGLGAYFGRPEGGLRAVCANPARLAGGKADLLAVFPAARGATIMTPTGQAGRDGLWLDPAAGTVATPFVALPGLVLGECVHCDGFAWLASHPR